MAITYCFQWNDLLKAPRDPYSEDAARRRHERGELYTVLVGDPDRPRALIEVSLGTQWVGLTLLDAELRRWRIWSFEGGTADERFFVDEYQCFHFDDEGRKRYTDLISFAKEGLLHVAEVDLVSRDSYTYDIRADVADMWTAAPTFGDYQSITRFESLEPFTSLPREAPWSKEWTHS